MNQVEKVTDRERYQSLASEVTSPKSILTMVKQLGTQAVDMRSESFGYDDLPGLDRPLKHKQVYENCGMELGIQL